MRKLLLTCLFLLPFSAQAEIECNDRANEIRKSDRPDEAISILGDCLSEELSRVARTYLLLGLSYYDQGEHARAIANYSKAIEFAPEYVTAYANRGLSYAMKKDYDRALQDFDRAIELDPSYMQAYYFRAFTNQKSGKLRAAVDDFSMALTLATDEDETATIYYNRGRVYTDLRGYDSALSDYNEAIRINPEFSRAYFSRGLLHHERKRVDEAIADYSRTISLDNRHARAFFNRGLLYRKSGSDFRAMKDFEAATDIEPTYARAYANRGYTMSLPLLPLIFILALG